MEQILDRLRYIRSDVHELAGVVTFGQSRLQQFHDALDVIENDISSIKNYRHYQTCTDEHRRIQTMLNTTLESLISWRSLALQHLQELNDLPIQMNHAGHLILQMTMQQVNRLIKDLHLHIQQLQQMQARSAIFEQQLTQQKRALPV